MDLLPLNRRRHWLAVAVCLILLTSGCESQPWKPWQPAVAAIARQAPEEGKSAYYRIKSEGPGPLVTRMSHPPSRPQAGGTAQAYVVDGNLSVFIQTASNQRASMGFAYSARADGLDWSVGGESFWAPVQQYNPHWWRVEWRDE